MNGAESFLLLMAYIMGFALYTIGACTVLYFAHHGYKTFLRERKLVAQIRKATEEEETR